jgi:hypothetical protein
MGLSITLEKVFGTKALHRVFFGTNSLEVDPLEVLPKLIQMVKDKFPEIDPEPDFIKRIDPKLYFQNG